MNQKGFALPILFIVISILIVLSIGSFYLGIKTQDKPKVSENLTAIVSPSPSPTDKALSPIFGPFFKRHYDLKQKFFNEKDYPDEMKKINETTLAELSCSNSFALDNHDSANIVYIDNKTQRQYRLEDPAINNLLIEAKKSLGEGKEIDAFIVCVTRDDRYILEYEVHNGGGGMENVSYFGFTEKGRFRSVTNIPNDGSPYFGCFKVLHLTLSNSLLIECGGGDGGFGSSSIYRMDLYSKFKNLIYKCSSTANEDLTDSKIECI